MGLFHFDLYSLPFRVIAFVIAFSLHEYAHALAAYSLGDRTAKNEGRLTINPLPHLDPFGLIMILFGPFGWAKPVPFNPNNFKGNKRLGIVYVAAAGPVINMILAFIFLLLFYMFQAPFMIEIMATWSDKVIEAIQLTIQYCVFINLGLMVFNLLPISPLDGSKIVRYITPHRWDRFFDKLDLYGPWLLLLIVLLPPFRSILVIPMEMTLKVLESIVRPIALQLFL
ncbi:site-2 protease family protein [Brevibacillus daliensis]|uniref:site-2 protease family protein n=1 Tax=Brevibacillus daliensis TaxID=2892995 RepID=UPI001E48BC66|nr:site-2 protease family protein [Brevibacillus daliensis]